MRAYITNPGALMLGFLNVKSGVFNEKCWGSNEKCGGSNEKCGGSNEKCGGSNEKCEEHEMALGFSDNSPILLISSSTQKIGGMYYFAYIVFFIFLI